VARRSAQRFLFGQLRADWQIVSGELLDN